MGDYLDNHRFMIIYFNIILLVSHDLVKKKN